MNSTMKRSLLHSVVAMVLCFSMLLGTTFAWFTDFASSDDNIITTGNLDIGMYWSENNVDWHQTEGANAEPIFNNNKWEPGYTEVRYVKVTNEGKLAFKYKMLLSPNGTVGKLANVIDVSYDIVTGNTGFVAPTEDNKQGSLTKVGTLKELISANEPVAGGVLLPENETKEGFYSGEIVVCIALHMDEEAGNEYKNQSIGTSFNINLYATQYNYELDSFGDQFDAGAKFADEIDFKTSATVAQLETVYGELASDFTIKHSNSVYAVLPAGVKLADGVTQLEFSGKTVETDSNITVGEGESAVSYDIHIEGIADDNTQPIQVYLGAILAKGLSDTSLKLYHEGTLMTRVNRVEDFSLNNQYTYDSETGEVVIYVDNFSIFSAVAVTVDEWDGTSDTTWYNENDTEFTLTTAEQFVGFRDLVDGGNTFEGKTVKLGTDIDLNKINFDPIGYNYDHLGGKVFKGTFDGQNHTVYNLYQNGWDLDPDKTNYSTYTYSTAGGGLFASIKNATVKNLAVSGANIVFECVDIGIVVGYAQGNCTFENIVVTDSKIANYQRYTGGVVGEVSGDPADSSVTGEHTFTNVVVDSSVKISSLWGDFDNACGGVIGGKWGNANVQMTNVIVAAEIDAFSDVTAAYQWYAYRRCGMLIGHTEQNSPKKALNAAADFLTCENVKVYYGDWVNYTYYEYENQDNATGRRYPWVRAEAGEHNSAFSNPRYGVPTHGGVKVTGLENSTDYTPIVFNQLYGGGQGVYGCSTHEGVTAFDLTTTKTIYIYNDQNSTDLKFEYWYRNGEDTWTTVVDAISMDRYEVYENVYKLELPEFVDGFEITTAQNTEGVTFTLSELKNGETYSVNGNKHEHAFADGTCACGATETAKWELLTNDIKVGDLVVFVYEEGKMELSSFSDTNTVYGIGTEYTTSPTGTMVFEVVEGFGDGTFAFKNAENYLNWSSGNSLSTSTTLDANSSWKVSVDGEGIATVLNASDNTRKLQWNSSDPRFACYTSSQKPISIYVKASKVTCTSCTFVEVERQNATCEEAGYIKESCTVCGLENVETIDALGHNYNGDNPYLCVNGCGVHNLPEAGSTITIQQALWIAETLANDKDTGSKKYVVTGVIAKDPTDVRGATDIVDANEDKIHITIIKNADGKVNYGDFATKPVKDNTITVSATIAKNSEGEAQLIDAWLTEHVDSDANSVCDVCGATIENNTPETGDYSGRYYIATIRTTGNYFYMTSNLGTASTKRYQAVDSGLTVLPGLIDTPADGYVFVLENNGDGTYSIYVEGVNGDNYLGWTSDNSGILVPKADALKLTVEVNDGMYNIHFKASDAERYLALNQNTGSNYFAWYKSGQKQNLVLISVKTCEHINTENVAEVPASCTTTGTTAGVKCSDCGKVISGCEEIAALGHTTDNGTCGNCGEQIGGSSEPGALSNATLTFNDTSKRTEFSTSKQVWVENGVTVTNNKSSSTTNVADYASPARFYAKSELIVSGAGMKTIVFDCNSSSYATALGNSITDATVSVSVSEDKVTVTFAEVVDSFTITLSAQVRMDSITVNP